MLLSFPDSLSGLFCALLGVYLFFASSATNLHFFLGALLDRNTVGFSFSLEPFCTEILRTSQLTQESIAKRLLEQRI